MALVTLDPLYKSARINLSNNNLTASGIYQNTMVRATHQPQSDITYCEITGDSVYATGIGIVNSLPTIDSTIGAVGSKYYYIPPTGTTGSYYDESTTAVSYGGKLRNNQILGLLINKKDNELTFYINGINQGIIKTKLTDMDEIYLAFASGASTQSILTANFGASNFKYLPSDLPTGTKSYDGNQKLNVKEKLLLQSNNKVYSLETMNTWYETKMTSNTAPTPLVASASSVYNTTTHAAWKAFDNLTNNSYGWATTTGSVKGWLKLDFSLPVKVNRMNIFATDTLLNSMPKSFYIQGSNDDKTFVNLLHVTNQTNWGVFENRQYKFNNDTAYRYYRIEVLENNGHTFTKIGEVSYGYLNNKITYLTEVSKVNFEKYGTDKMDKLNLIFTHKNYMLQDAISEDIDGLWKTQLTSKPINIKFE